MNARQAYSIAKSSYDANLQPIIDKIKTASKKGDFSIQLYEVVAKYNVEQLQKLGYKVTSTNYRNEPLTTVSWNIEADKNK